MADVGCARPTGASVNQPVTESPPPSPQPEQEVVSMAQARVGKVAPDFQAPAYYKGEFTSVKLSDVVSKGWTLICFYPGDFTYV
ncbi:MAG: redoxin domain-containing protein [Chloroflexi bacterium]|nr:redoxin domain-containing protein [Chloroflexota bacterium]